MRGMFTITTPPPEPRKADFTIKSRMLEPTFSIIADEYAPGFFQGMSVSFEMWPEDGKGTRVIGPAVVANAAENILSYPWRAGDTDTPGRYLCHFVTTVGGRPMALPRASYYLIEILPH